MDILLLLILGVGILYWQDGMWAKEIATKAARNACKQSDVQFLDQTVQQIKISLSRDVSGRWRVWRRYRFEYARNGVDRENGRVTLLGNRPIETELQTIYPNIH